VEDEKPGTGGYNTKKKTHERIQTHLKLETHVQSNIIILNSNQSFSESDMTNNICEDFAED